MSSLADAFEDAGAVPPRTRGFALVGEFLQWWSFMEAEIRAAIATALGLSRLQAVFVCANISLRDKINILKTAVSVSYIPVADAASYKKLLDNIATHAAVRNMIAHDMFFPADDGKSVSFFVVKAKGKLEIPDVVWDRAKFRQEYETLRNWTQELTKLRQTLADAKVAEALTLRPMAALSEMSNADQPMPSLFALAYGHPPTLPPEEPPQSNPAPSNEETSPQTPSEPED